ncbi:MAG: branched-chain amino acid ABC transporter permease [Candidatus Rokuibacteriota bacterium]|nr:MAG: branched-chain amino acid ABC transporter permease [Candidatus Rokubacteria bacterium]
MSCAPRPRSSASRRSCATLFARSPLGRREGCGGRATLAVALTGVRAPEQYSCRERGRPGARRGERARHMVSAFVAWSAQRAAGLPLLLAFACGVAAGGVLAYVVERVVIRRAVSATHWDVLIITLGLSLMLRAGAGMVWTNDELPFPSLFSNRPVSFGPVKIAPVSLGIIGASLVLMLALVMLFRATRFGRAMRAVAQNQNAARLMGISVERVYSGAWVLAAVVGAVGGVLFAPVTFLSTKMGLIAINGFTAAVLGGFGSMPGAVVGGMLLGVIENLAPLYLPTGIRYSVPFLVMIAILLARPRGLFGRVERRKV